MKRLIPWLLFAIIVSLGSTCVLAQSSVNDIQIARIKYRGGGDWYNDPSALQNLLHFAAEQAPSSLSLRYKDIDLGDPSLYQYPFAFMTGHGGLDFNSVETKNLRDYLDYGGFLYIDDDYGFDSSIRALVASLYPDEKMVELPFNHPIYQTPFRFASGLPKIHEHDGKPPKGFGIFRNGRLVLFYSYESNLSDGWTDAEIHKNPASLRKLALQMGTNILYYAINGG